MVFHSMYHQQWWKDPDVFVLSQIFPLYLDDLYVNYTSLVVIHIWSGILLGVQYLETSPHDWTIFFILFCYKGIYKCKLVSWASVLLFTPGCFFFFFFFFFFFWLI